MTTPESVLLTQIPIALGIFWLAWELRRLRRSLDTHLEEIEDEAGRASDARGEPEA